jgi:hypothetical protein
LENDFAPLLAGKLAIIEIFVAVSR